VPNEISYAAAFCIADGSRDWRTSVLAERAVRFRTMAIATNKASKLKFAGQAQLLLLRAVEECCFLTDHADRLVVMGRGDIIAGDQDCRSACVLNNSLGRLHGCRIGGGSTEVRGVQAIVRMSDAAVTFDTQIDVKGSRSRASGNVRESL